jgi:hypothetical protein
LEHEVAEVTRVFKTAPVPAKIEWSAVRLTPKDIEHLRIGLEYAYSVHKPYSYAPEPVRALYKTLGHAKDGKTTEAANSESKATVQDFVSLRVF